MTTPASKSVLGSLLGLFRAMAPVPLFLLTACSGAGTADDVPKGDATASAAAPMFLRAPEEVPSTKLSSGTCPYSPAPIVMKRAVCVCDDLSLSGSLITKATLGGTADVGTNGSFAAASETQIAGSLVAKEAISLSGSLRVASDLATAGDVSGAGELHVARDLVGGGDVSMSGELQVDGALSIAGGLAVAGAQKIGKRGSYAPITEPCGCDGKALFDVAARVGAARTQNDNGKVAGLSDELVTAGEGELVLPTGNYYVKRIVTSGASRIRVTGAVALHVDGDLDAAGRQLIELDKGASLDLFIAGSLATAGDLVLGEGAEAGSFRVYVGGKDVAHAGEARYHGLLYAPHATVAFSGSTTVYGAVFAKQLSFAGELVVDYRSASAASPTTCTPEAAPTPGASSPALK